MVSINGMDLTRSDMSLFHAASVCAGLGEFDLPKGSGTWVTEINTRVNPSARFELNYNSIDRTPFANFVWWCG